MNQQSGDGIERLLRATGRRPAPPAERATRVREAVWVHWRTERRRRLRRRVLWIGVAAAAASVLVAVLLLWRPQATIAGRIERAEPPVALASGDAVETGSTLSTEDGGRIACRLGSGHAIRLDRATRVRIRSDRRVVLDAGALYVDSAGAEGRLEIETPFGSLQDLGTQFLVRLSAGVMEVRVREGVVVLTAGGDRVQVHAGQVLEAGKTGPVLRPDGEAGAWTWIGEVAPTPAIAGRSAREFLDWAAREKGLPLRFEDAGLEEVASKTILQGSIEGMTVDQALDSVLPTCGMQHRIERNALQINGVD
jgi:ferric-dicitrate binding protein FerR (iron transport regulator)